MELCLHDIFTAEVSFCLVVLSLPVRDKLLLVVWPTQVQRKFLPEIKIKTLMLMTYANERVT